MLLTTSARVDVMEADLMAQLDIIDKVSTIKHLTDIRLKMSKKQSSLKSAKGY